MSDSAGERARLRRYPELPVWVVEDHQEVSGRLPGVGAEPRQSQGGGGASAPEARERSSICYPRGSIAVGKNTPTANLEE